MVKVRASLDGLEVRNAMRAAAREMEGRVHMVYNARRHHLVDTVGAARKWLTAAGIRWVEDSKWGVTLLATDVRVPLVYGPDGSLQWTANRTVERPEQTPLWVPDEMPLTAALRGEIPSAYPVLPAGQTH